MSSFSCGFPLRGIIASSMKRRLIWEVRSEVQIRMAMYLVPKSMMLHGILILIIKSGIYNPIDNVHMYQLYITWTCFYLICYREIIKNSTRNGESTKRFYYDCQIRHEGNFSKGQSFFLHKYFQLCNITEKNIVLDKKFELLRSFQISFSFITKS